MSVRRGHAGRVDSTHADVVKALRGAGMCAYSIAQVGGGVPDILAAWRGFNFLIEVKGESARLTADEQKFHDTWAGQVAIVRTPEEAVIAVLRAWEAAQGRAA